MKSAFIITNTEMVSILKGALAKKGFDTTNLTVRFTATNAVVAGITEVGSFEENEEDEDEDYQDSGSVQQIITDQARAKLTMEPYTAQQLAAAISVSTYAAERAISLLGAQNVGPTRENGKTVTKWMLPGTVQYTQIAEAEKTRVEQRVAELGSLVLSHVPKFHEHLRERPQIVDEICATLSPEQAEEMRRDAKAVFYRMAELGTLEHKYCAWRAGATETDRVNVASLQGAIREALSTDLGTSTQGLLEKLPGFVPESLLGYAIRRMDNVYETDGLLYLKA